MIGRLPTINALLVIGFFFASAFPASAGLGANPAAIQTDAAAMGAKISEPAAATSATSSDGYVVTSFVTSKGVTVREYSSHAGPIFGVAWEGRRPPDLRVLLGSYYSEFQAAAAAHNGPIGLHRAVIVGPNSTVFLSGHMGHVVGRAYAPSLTPAGIDPKAVVQ